MLIIVCRLILIKRIRNIWPILTLTIIFSPIISPTKQFNTVYQSNSCNSSTPIKIPAVQTVTPRDIKPIPTNSRTLQIQSTIVKIIRLSYPMVIVLVVMLMLMRIIWAEGIEIRKIMGMEGFLIDCTEILWAKIRGSWCSGRRRRLCNRSSSWGIIRIIRPVLVKMDSIKVQCMEIIYRLPISTTRALLSLIIEIVRSSWKFMRRIGNCKSKPTIGIRIWNRSWRCWLMRNIRGRLRLILCLGLLWRKWGNVEFEEEEMTRLKT